MPLDVGEPVQSEATTYRTPASLRRWYSNPGEMARSPSSRAGFAFVGFNGSAKTERISVSLWRVSEQVQVASRYVAGGT